MWRQLSLSLPCAVLAVWLSGCSAGAPLAADPARPISGEQLEQWMKEVSNWGRWGAEDQLGTLNLLTPEKRRQAAALVQDGHAVSLARNVETNEAPDNPNPFQHEMVRSGADNPTPFAVDRYSVHYHGFAHTHMDALCHMFWKGKMYNGFSQQEVTARGAGKLSIHHVKQGIFTRGILLDIPHLKKLDWLEPGASIYPEDLDAFEEMAGLKVEPGDVVFVYTGRWKRRDAQGPWNASEKSAGLHASCARWLHERDIAMLGSDASSDVKPSGVEGFDHPVHQLVLIAMGTPIFDNCDLEALAAACRERQRWEFLLTAAPLPVEGGTGSPLNPIAVF